MNRIQKISSYLVTLFNILLIGIPLLHVGTWALLGTPFFVESDAGFYFSLIKAPEGLVNPAIVQWTPLTKFIDLLATIVHLLPTILGLFILRSLFQNYQKGEIFNAQNARRYRYLGWLFFLNALITKPLGDMLEVLAVTLSNPPGHRYISLGFGTPNMEEIFCGLLIVVISWVMLEGYKLKEDQNLTI